MLNGRISAAREATCILSHASSDLLFFTAPHGRWVVALPRLLTPFCGLDVQVSGAKIIICLSGTDDIDAVVAIGYQEGLLAEGYVWFGRIVHQNLYDGGSANLPGYSAPCYRCINT